jgi:hypothetical protein
VSGEPLELDELVEHWTLLDGDRELVAGKRGASRLAFALMLKFYARHGRFPDDHADLPGDVVEFVARQVQVAPGAAVRGYEFSGRTSEYHRAQIRRHFGFCECTVEDARGLQAWLAEHVAEADPRAEVVRDELLDRCRKWRVEPPSEGRAERIVRAAIHGAQTAVCERIVARLSAESITTIEQLLLVADAGDGETESVLALIKSAPGNVSLETMFVEIEKLEAVRAVGLPAGLFSDVTPRVLADWRQRASVESPSHLREHPRALRLTLLAALLWARERELTDTLVDLLIATFQALRDQLGVRPNSRPRPSACRPAPASPRRCLRASGSSRRPGSR